MSKNKQDIKDTAMCQIQTNDTIVFKTKYKTSNVCESKIKNLSCIGVVNNQSIPMLCSDCNHWHISMPDGVSSPYKI